MRIDFVVPGVSVHLNSNPQRRPAAQQQKVQFRSSLRAVEVRVALAVGDQRLLQSESFPAGPV